MKVFIVSEGDDVGGVAIAIQRAFERYGGPGWEVRSMRGSNNYIDYPMDLEWNYEQFVELWQWADVIHAMEKLHNLTPHFNPPGKPLVVHHHGTIYRDNHAALDAVSNAHNLVQICSTIDLTQYNPQVEWLPNPIDVSWMEHIRAQYQAGPSGVLRYSHTPTQRWAKHTDYFIQGVKAVHGRLELVEMSSWSHALARKATADVLLDQLYYGYGLSGLEAMAMGIAVVGGATVEGIESRIMEAVGYLPYHRASPGTIGMDLVPLNDPAFRAEVAERGRQYVNDFHSQPVIVDRLKALYTEAVDRYEPEEAWP